MPLSNTRIIKLQTKIGAGAVSFLYKETITEQVTLLLSVLLCAFVLQLISVSLTPGFCTWANVPLIDKDDCPIVTLRLYRPKTRVEMN